MADISDLQARRHRLEDGTLRFTDERNGKVEQVSAVNVKLGLRSLSSPLIGSGNFAWRDQRIDFDGKLPDVRDIFNQKPAHLTFNAKSRLDHRLLRRRSSDQGRRLHSKARCTAQSDSARDARELVRNEAASRFPGFGPLSIEGTLKTSGNVTDFSNAEFGLDGATAQGYDQGDDRRRPALRRGEPRHIANSTSTNI